jgi:predicted RNA binding protein YcfA (HicA-like mRNA interferase family)
MVWQILSMKIRDIIKLIEADGWYLVNREGSHRQYKHLIKKGRVTIAGKPGDEIKKGTLNSILKQSGLK